MTKIEIEIPAGKRAEWQEIDGKTTLVLVDEKEERPVTERVKTFADACQELGIDAESWLKGNEAYKMEKDVLAYLKLRIICTALNEGWKPEFIVGELRWHPWFYLWTKEVLSRKNEEWEADNRFIPVGDLYAGFVCSGSDGAPSITAMDLGSRICLKTKDLADYCGTQFINIWKDYLFG